MTVRAILPSHAPVATETEEWPLEEDFVARSVGDGPRMHSSQNYIYLWREYGLSVSNIRLILI